MIRLPHVTTVLQCPLIYHVLCLAGLYVYVTRRLSWLVVDMNVHRWEQVSDKRPAVSAIRPVASVDGSRVPVGPVEWILEQCQSKRMRKLKWVGHHFSPITAVQLWTVNVAVLAVSPVQSAGVIVNGQTIRPEDSCRYYHLSCWRVSIHSGPLNLGIFTPVCPEH